MAQEREKNTKIAHPAEQAAVDEALCALVRALAKMWADEDYEASKAQTSHPPKGSSS